MSAPLWSIGKTQSQEMPSPQCFRKCSKRKQFSNSQIQDFFCKFIRSLSVMQHVSSSWSSVFLSGVVGGFYCCQFILYIYQEILKHTFTFSLLILHLSLSLFHVHQSPLFMVFLHIHTHEFWLMLSLGYDMSECPVRSLMHSIYILMYH